jgi:Flp pilus assembly protein TadD
MVSWVEEVLHPHGAREGSVQLEALQRALFEKEFDFNYDSDLTLTAAEAFEQRRGNCMSFTALFVTMARSAGIPVFLMTVRRAPEVDKKDDLVIVNRHVVAAYRDPAGVRVYDFYITSADPYMHQRVVDDVMASAMYHTNLGGAAIRANDTEQALRHLRIATTLAPDWAAGWVNLGVAKFRTGDTDGALAAYGAALEADPYNPSALTNIAHVYHQLGMEAESETALRAAAHRTTNPYTLIAMADAEMIQGRYGRARRYLRKARRWYPSEPEVYDAMARLARRRGEAAAAGRHSAKAAKLRLKEARRELSPEG